LSWSANVEYLPGQPNEFIVAGVNKPLSIKIDTEHLARLDSAPTAERMGWSYAEEHRAVLVRFIQPIKQTEIHITW
jgi:hypothetical protein